MVRNKTNSMWIYKKINSIISIVKNTMKNF